MKPIPSRLITGSAIGSLSSAVVGLWRDWRAKRRPVVMRPFIDQHSRWRVASRLLIPLGLAIGCFVYGFFFALTAPYLIVPFAAPALVLGVLSIWALPDTDKPPLQSLELVYSTCLPGLILWPNYLALSLPGLPWVTVVRLTAFPMAFFLAVSLSTSAQFREKILGSAKGVPVTIYLLLLFAANSVISLPLAHSVGDAIQKLMILLVTWAGMFIGGLYVFQLPGRPERYIALLLMLAVSCAVITTLEFQEQHTMWAGHVPSFLKVQADSVNLALSNIVRASTGQYRAKAAFGTPLGLAEYMSLMTPFAIHWVVGRYPAVQRLFGLALLPIIYIVVRMTDSRLGILGYLVSVMTYLVIWSLVRFRRRLNDLLAAILVYAYPAAIIGVLAASMVVHKIHVLIFGGGAQAASNDARKEQFLMALPGLIRNPIGWGAGQGARQMGYGVGDFIAVDSYWITLSLDFGALGVVLYVGLFAVVIYAALKTMIQHPEVARGEVGLLIPLVAFMAAFLMIRGVFAEPDIHPLVFALLGMSVCLITRAKNSVAASKAAQVAPAGIQPRLSRRAAVGPSSESADKPMPFGMVVLVMVGCAIAYYVGCVVWRLIH